MSSPWRRRLGFGCGALLVLAGLGLAFSWRSGLLGAMAYVLETDELQGQQLTTSDDVWRYLREHPDRYALAVWDLDRPDGGFFHDADAPWPLASTVKVIPLALVSARLADGRWREDTELPHVEAMYLPKTDGNAHVKATAAFDGGVRTIGTGLSAMIRFSDNAATDALLLRLGQEAVEAEARGLGALDPPHPLSAMPILSQRGQFQVPQVPQSPDPWTLARRLRDEPDFEAPLRTGAFQVPVAEQERAVKAIDNRGTARAFATLLETIFSDDARWAAARDRLSWPMAFSRNQQEFTRWGTKGGSLPGVLTSAHFAETKGGRRRVVALFLHDLPFATWVGLSRSFAQQAVERQLLLADDPAGVARERLSAPAPGP